ncbi:MAG: tetratricopeptide repeat protein [Burkholderiales bacterium]|nr:tetratricopeptide repeat protein [Anaerolineae bacterium]
MPDAGQSVFISYRRSVSSFIARAVFMDLRAHDYDVFMDVETIDAGEFRTVILNQIAARAHFLLILTPGTLDRVNEPGDWLRTEIEHALSLQRNIVPLLVNNFDFKDTEPFLTGELSRLSGINALEVPHSYFDAAMERMRTRFLRQQTYGEIVPTPPAERAEVERKINEAASRPAPTEQQLEAAERLNRGLALQSSGDYDGAFAAYTDALRLNPQFAEGYCYRGTARHERREFTAAIADFTQAMRLNPNFAEAYYHRGAALRDDGKLDEAIIDFTAALHISPYYAEAYLSRGNAYVDKGDYDAAIANYYQALRFNPGYAEAYYSRANVYAEKGDPDAAIVDYSEALRLNPQLVEAYYNRAIARSDQGDYKGAIEDYSEALRLNPRFSHAYYNRGIARKAKGDLKGAISDYQTYLDLGGGRRYGDQAEVEQILRGLKGMVERS